MYSFCLDQIRFSDSLELYHDYGGYWVTLGSFSSKTRTSLKTQLLLLFYVLEHSNFPAVPLIESCSQANKFPKISLHSCISIICDCAHIAFCFPSRRSIFAVRPSKVYFSGRQFQNRTYNKSLETCKFFEVDFTL